MEHLPEDQKVVDLISKLKKSNGAYPSDMLASRRQQYLKQVANVGLGIGVGAGLKHAVKSGGNGAGTTATLGGKVLETVLIAAIVIESGTAAYLYRGKIADWIQSFTSPTVQQAAAQSEDAASQNLEPDVVIVAPSVAASNTPSATPAGTPAPGVAGSNNDNSSSAGFNATPSPDGSVNGSSGNNGNNGNNGNQYGLTPKPDRDKDNNGGGNGGDGGNGEGGGGNGGNGGGGNDGNNNGGGNKKP